MGVHTAFHPLPLFPPRLLTLLHVKQNNKQELIMDGQTVLSRSGPRSVDVFNRFPFAKRRKNSEKYEMRATEEGVEVRLEGRHVWSIRAADIDDYKEIYKDSRAWRRRRQLRRQQQN